MICELDAFLESLNLTAPPLERDLKGDVKFVQFFKKYEIGDISDEEIEEGEIVEEKEVGVEYFDNFSTRSELAYHKIDPESLRGISNFTGRIRGMHIFVGNFTYVLDFLIVEDISSVLDPSLSYAVLRKPFVEVSNMTYDSSLGIVKFTNGTNKIAYMMPHKIELFKSLSNMKKSISNRSTSEAKRTKEEEWIM
ncbi:hypothetical protein Tco_1042538 [Tanacetum coccineum]|uniref:MAK10-like protein n=1 Tax=Tanacetum coccineum TaxID=301880 RepID=A0ABQ5GJZ5_9ASTR